MADYRHFCVFDFETGSKYPETAQIIQIGASILNRNSLEIVDSFQSLVKPKDFDALEDEALAINHITKEQLEDAPDVDIIFHTWAEWIKNWNTKKDNSSWGAPLPCGWGSDRFDVPILSRYCKEYGYWDEKYDNMNLMNGYFSFDAMRHFHFWTLNNKEVKNCKLATAVLYMGLATEEEIEKCAHDAGWDVWATAMITQKFLRISRWANEFNENTGKRRLPMQNCFNGEHHYDPKK